MTIKITDKHGVKVDGKSYDCGQLIDKEEDNTTKQSLVDCKVAEIVNEKPIKEKNV